MRRSGLAAALGLRWHTPHRTAVHDACAAELARGGVVLHIAVHSFTPVLYGHTRDADVGLLYDPARARERSFAGRWCAALLACAPTLRVRMNYPYRATSDRLGRSLCRRFGDRRYAALEFEMNQALLESPPRWRRAMAAIEASLRAGPRESTHASASWGLVTPRAAASSPIASTSARLRARLSCHAAGC